MHITRELLDWKSFHTRSYLIQRVDWSVLESQLSHKVVNLIFGLSIANNNLTILWGNWLSKTNYEIHSVRHSHGRHRHFKHCLHSKSTLLPFPTSNSRTRNLSTVHLNRTPWTINSESRGGSLARSGFQGGSIPFASLPFVSRVHVTGVPRS